MAFHRVCLSSVRLEPTRNVVAARAARVKPVFECGTPTAMPEHIAIPHPLQRGHFVVARAAPSLESETRVGSDRNRQNVILLFCSRWRREAFSRGQLVIGIERWRVARWAALAREHLLSACGNGVKLVRVEGRLEGVNIKRQSIELLIAISRLSEFSERGGIGRVPGE